MLSRPSLFSDYLLLFRAFLTIAWIIFQNLRALKTVVYEKYSITQDKESMG
jgi:hypothetical protein